jgi:hypothetical protein
VTLACEHLSYLYGRLHGLPGPARYTAYGPSSARHGLNRFPGAGSKIAKYVFGDGEQTPAPSFDIVKANCAAADRGARERSTTSAAGAADQLWRSSKRLQPAAARAVRPRDMLDPSPRSRRRDLGFHSSITRQGWCVND